jgi:DNA-binding transcriptional LysR family regulator
MEIGRAISYVQSIDNIVTIIYMDNLRRADLPLLVSLDTLLAEQSVTRAAERLGMSQPALSAQLARLRDLFDDPLLIQSGRRMVPTPRAEALAQTLHRLVGDMGALVREAQIFDPSVANRTFRIAATDYLHATVSGPALTRFAKAAPHVKVALCAFDAQRTWSMLDDSTVDLLIGSERLIPQSAIAKKLHDEDFALFRRCGHPLKTVDLDNFCNAQHLLVSPQGGGFFGAVDEALLTMGRKRNVARSIPSFLLAASLLANSDLIAVMPERIAPLLGNDFIAEPVPIALEGFPVFAAWHPRNQRDPGHQWLREMISEKTPI